LIAILLPVLIAISAFAINLAYMESVRTDVQIASDAASRAACRTHALTLNTSSAIASAQDAVRRNTIVGTAFTLPQSDVKFETSVRSLSTGKCEFTEASNGINAVRVNLSTASGGGLPLPFHVGLGASRFSTMQTLVASHSDLDIVLVLDRSGAMAYGTDEVAAPAAPPKRAPSGWAFGQPVPPGSRWLDAVNAVNEFLGVLAETPQKENVGLVTYNFATSVDADLSVDCSSIGPAIDRYTQKFDAGGTAIGDGLYTGCGLMTNSSQARPWAVPVVIVLTDGIWNFGSNPVDAAWSGRNHSRTMTYAITFSDEADQSRMAQVAAAGGGKHYHAATGSQLSEVFRTIARDLPILTTE
jgi:Ca-activated chloride channel family protein